MWWYGLKDIYRCRVCGKYVEEEFHCGVRAVPVLDSKRRLLLSKLMSGLLRHYPWEAGLRIDTEGWISIDELVRGIRERWRNKELYQWVTPEHIIAVALLDPKGRFEIKNNKIRARYGHSIDIRINYEVVDSVDVLYHGTSRDRVGRILLEGVKPMKRKYVHLTNCIEDAIETGRRHGHPVVLVINIKCLKTKGMKVYRASNKVYLTEYIPPECIEKVLYT